MNSEENPTKNGQNSTFRMPRMVEAHRSQVYMGWNNKILQRCTPMHASMHTCMSLTKLLISSVDKHVVKHAQPFVPQMSFLVSCMLINRSCTTVLDQKIEQNSKTFRLIRMNKDWETHNLALNNHILICPSLDACTLERSTKSDRKCYLIEVRQYALVMYAYASMAFEEVRLRQPWECQCLCVLNNTTYDHARSSICLYMKKKVRL